MMETKLRYHGRMQGGTPKVVALIALSPYSDIRKVTRHLLKHCGIERRLKKSENVHDVQAQIGGKKSNFVIFECVDRDDTFSILDICKIADIILLVASPSPKSEDNEQNDCILGLDDRSKLFCSLIKSVGGATGATVYGLYQPKFYLGLGNKRKNNKAQQCKLDPMIKSTFLNYLRHQFGTSSDSKNIRIFECFDTVQIFRFMNDTKHYNDSKTVSSEWKQKRPHLLIQRINGYDREGNVLQIDGYLRGSTRFNIQRPVHITGFGDYAVDRIDGLVRYGDHEKRIAAKQEEEEVMAVDGDDDDDDDDDSKVMDGEFVSTVLLTANKEERDTVKAVEDLDGLASQFDQTIITEQELEEIEKERKERIEREKLEKQGLLDYNKGWLPSEEEDGDGDEEWKQDEVNMSDGEMDLDGIEEEVAKQREIEKEEFEFPDEVEIPNGVRAKDEFAEYRGLKQFYKTKWDKFEELPAEYARIANVGDWKKALKVTKLENILKFEKEGNQEKMTDCGKRVRLHIAGISEDVHSEMALHLKRGKPLIAWCLLEHECKVSVLNFVVRKCSAEYDKPVEGLKPYIFDMGFRRFRACPVFSEHSRGNKHLVKQFMGDGEFVMASIYGHITYPPVGVMMMEEKSGAICAQGSLHNVDAHRLLIQRKVLTGAAIRVQRRRAVIRDMFFYSDDVKYFKPVDLWTKHGLKGRIEEPIGDRGLMKCFFNDILKQSDTICLSLYKRVFPVNREDVFGKMT